LKTWVKLPGGNRGLVLAGDNPLRPGGERPGHRTFLTCTLGTSYIRDVLENTPRNAYPVDGGRGRDAHRLRAPSCERSVSGSDRSTRWRLHCAAGKARPWITYPNGFTGAVECAIPWVVADSFALRPARVRLASIQSVSPELLLYRTLVEELEVPDAIATAWSASAESAGAPSSTPAQPFNPRRDPVRSLTPRASVSHIQHRVGSTSAESSTPGSDDARRGISGTWDRYQ